MPSISIPTALRQYAGAQASAPVEATSVREALDKLTAQFPDLRKHLFDANGKLRSFVNVYVNDEDIRYLQKEDTAIKEKDEISIVP
jgi:adenylyltransferase/sulfurtransferase